MKTFIFTFLFALQVAAADPQWRQLKTWEPGVTGPSEREHPTLWIDPENPDQLHLFGGMNYLNPQTATNDFWTLDLKTETWQPVPQLGILPGSMGRITEADGKMYYYGGSKDGFPSPQLFTVEVKNAQAQWHMVNVQGQVLRNSLSSLVYDPDTKELISACGFNEQVHCRVQRFKLLLDGSVIADIPNRFGTDTPPAGRYGFPFAFNKKAHLMVVGTGQLEPFENETGMVYQQAKDTWAFQLVNDMAVWTRLQGPQPPQRRNSCWAMDTDKNYLYMWGGTSDGRDALSGVYRLNMKELTHGWEAVATVNEPPAHASCAAVYDSPRHRLLFGFGNALTEDRKQILKFTDLWELSLN